MNDLTLTSLENSNIDEIAAAFKQIGWHKPKSIYEAYLEEQLMFCNLINICQRIHPH
jgi:hypothetical protein